MRNGFESKKDNENSKWRWKMPNRQRNMSIEDCIHNKGI